MDHGEARIFMVEAPVVAAADPFDPEGRTADLTLSRAFVPPAPEPPDPLVAGPGPAEWSQRFGAVLGRNALALLPVTLLAALPMHFFVGRLDEAVIAAPYLSDVAGGLGLLLLPFMWLAYLAVSALPQVLSLAGATGVAVPRAAEGSRPRLRRTWSLVALRLRALWLWFAAFSVLTGSLPLVLTEDQFGLAAAVPLAVVLGAVSTGLLTLGGMLGCVVLIERGQAWRRSMYLLSRSRPVGLIAAAAGATFVPGVTEAVLGGFAATAAGVVAVQLWAIAALVTYAQARRADEPVTSLSLLNELAAPED
ncbi:hypothetical protein M1L60_18950 [Actinoplanes sp. TRM 88003]|uniref:Integral membrane protein n=1 Tax=Paractinoplanes aksuensis TaxID=2939490 RepID=A0ABT1DPA5_9ACTN|nr:hypothetical protein [Actinoplanes aksuensis]MCO8272677.1 hypothetical protein [Actinoplanes aksuensis]